MRATSKHSRSSSNNVFKRSPPNNHPILVISGSFNLRRSTPYGPMNRGLIGRIPAHTRLQRILLPNKTISRRSTMPTKLSTTPSKMYTVTSPKRSTSPSPMPSVSQQATKSAQRSTPSETIPGKFSTIFVPSMVPVPPTRKRQTINGSTNLGTQTSPSKHSLIASKNDIFFLS